MSSTPWAVVTTDVKPVGVRPYSVMNWMMRPITVFGLSDSSWIRLMTTPSGPSKAASRVSPTTGPKLLWAGWLQKLKPWDLSFS